MATITDLTGYTVTVPSGWTATAGYGEYSINYDSDISEEIYSDNDSFRIGYSGSSSKANYVSVYSGGSLGGNYSSSYDLVLYITGGTDATNTFLIQWLVDNNATFTKEGEEEETPSEDDTITDLTGTTWKLNDTVARLGQVEYDIQGTAVFEDETYNCDFNSFIGQDQGNIRTTGDCEVDIILGTTDDDYESGFAGVLLNPDGRVIYSAYSSSSASDTLSKTTTGLSTISTITITGGNDVTDTDLIAWLYENGELQETTEDNPTEDETETTEAVTIQYNGSTLATITEGQTITLHTNGKKALTDIVISVGEAAEEETGYTITCSSFSNTYGSKYYYSLDSGATWNEITAEGTLATNVTATTIMIKVATGSSVKYAHMAAIDATDGTEFARIEMFASSTSQTSSEGTVTSNGIDISCSDSNSNPYEAN